MQSTILSAKLFLILSALVNCITDSSKINERSYEDNNAPVIATDKGLVRGHKANDGDYLRFLGIPFGAPPTGENRYKAPLPTRPWTGILEANHTVECVQMNRGDEDCLKLNIFTPTSTRTIDDLLPVLLHISGGAYVGTSVATEGLGPVVEKNIIVVTINYRVGPLGFLCLGTEEAPGNAGLKDQVAALEWVQRNIVNFGGDPNQVTLYGTSAGSASAELLVLSKLTNGLFHRAIFESGSAFDSATIDLDPITTAMDLAKLANFMGDSENMNSLVDFYKKIPADKLTRINAHYYEDPGSDKMTNGNIGFVPCLENTNLNNVQPLITEHPLDIIRKQSMDYFKQLDIMSIYARFEGFLLKSEQFYTLNYGRRMNTNFEIFLPSNLVFDNKERKIKVAQYVKEFYFGTEPVSEETILPYLEFFGDALITHSRLLSAKLHSNRSKVYSMEFSYRGDSFRNSSEHFKEVSKAGHSDAKRHLFLSSPIVSEQDQVIVDRMSTLVTNFVRFGDPTPVQNEIVPIVWPAVQAERMNYLLMEEDMSIREHPHYERMKFWDELIQKYGRYEDFEPLYP